MIMYYRDPTSDLVWVYIPKNMSTTMGAVVNHYRWQRVDNIGLIPKTCHVFSIIQNPWTRFCKGMAELAWTMDEKSFERVRKDRFWRMAFIDSHLMPISVQVPEALPYLNYVPMDAPTRTADDLLNELFVAHGSTTRVTVNLHQHVSQPRKVAYQKEVRAWLEEKYPYRKQVNQINSYDHEQWHRAVDPYRVTPLLVQESEPSFLGKVRNWILG